MMMQNRKTFRWAGLGLALCLMVQAAAVSASAAEQNETEVDASGWTVAEELSTFRWIRLPSSDGEGQTEEAGRKQVETEAYSEEYQESVFYQRLKQVELTGDYRSDILAVAKSQLGYHEGDDASGLDGGSDGSKDYTEYGRLMGTQGSAWCSEFASWCAWQAGVPQEIFGNAVAAVPSQFGGASYSWSDTVYAGGDYQPQPGDLVLFAWNGTSRDAAALDHTALICGVEEEDGRLFLEVLHGNSGNSVKRSRIEIEDPESGRMYKGYAARLVAPSYEASGSGAPESQPAD